MANSAPPQDFHFRVEVPFGPRWQHVELLRMSILNCLATIFQSHDFCEQLGMVTAELVENAINYGNWMGSEVRPFRLAVRGVDGAVTVEVSNPVDPSANSAARLQSIIERLKVAGTAKDAYVARLREIADDPDQRGSGLGLMRVAYETGCQLDVHIDDQTARVVATIRGSGEAQ